MPDLDTTPVAAPHRRRRTVVVSAIVGAVVLVVAVIIAVVVAPQRGTDASPTPSPDASAQADGFERPAGWSQHRPAVHFTPENNWMNDPQKPFLLDGLWHYYYLYNADHPEGNGTAWYHSTSTDLVHWEDQGIAIEKYANGLGDIWTGTAVVDERGSAGFGEGAVIALVTQQHDGVQRQSLFVSTDGGYEFESYEGNPVMENPGAADWRDPRVFWDDAAGHWVMALAEHDRIGFYTSRNLRDWTYSSDFATTGLGVLECPDLFPMAVDGDPDDVRWVLVAGANGAAEGMTTGTAYWTGDWDGERFVADGAGHQWLDHGSDYYAAVTWDDPRLSADERLASRYGIGWMNNWAYAGRFPTEDWQGGSDSIVRSIRLVSDGGRATLRSTPAAELLALEGEAQPIDDARLDPGGGAEIPVPSSDAYRLRLDVAAADDAEVRVTIATGDGRFATVGYDFAAGVAFVARDADAVAAGMPEAYRELRTAPVAAVDGRLHLDVVVDAASVEVFAGDGEAALTMATFGAGGERGLRIESVRGPVEVTDASVTPLRVAPVERQSSERRG
ncbi:glycoside hydrolase family 32 protein [Microbacterium sp. CFBP9034]|uniref:glycoside hydrolase family 32 protein n=1 Tax=Microbacterium sp. CFBP9034 TaxID=3096540 RepID=UPI002A6A0291|nr:glycoside hydrolase family 32 protein [Microbacterium sp. CFBP9034]MDY0908569.1 glycoside hydrolase family 32 protein [Microbacterium sp. CFBP9034]